MRRIGWEVYVPDYEGNREKRGKGQPAITVKLRSPSATIWRRFMVAVSDDPGMQRIILQRMLETKNARAAAGAAVQLATLRDDLAEILYLPCVGEFSNFTLDDGTVVKDGPHHWELRSEIDGVDLYQDILQALILRSHLDVGLEAFLALASGPPASDAQAPSLAGTAGSAASPA